MVLIPEARGGGEEGEEQETRKQGPIYKHIQITISFLQ